MTKDDLTNTVASRLGETTTRAAIIVETILEGVVAAIQRGEEVELRGFGSFRFRHRAARKGRNPRTGVSVDVPPRRVVYFRMGRELRAALVKATDDSV